MMFWLILKTPILPVLTAHESVNSYLFVWYPDPVTVL